MLGLFDRVVGCVPAWLDVSARHGFLKWCWMCSSHGHVIVGHSDLGSYISAEEDLHGS